MAQRPPTISIREVSKAVEHAVKVASEKHKVQFSPAFRLGPGTIMGRQILQADIGLKQAEQVAAEITQHVAGGGVGAAPTLGTIPLEPAVLVRPGIIICGFWPPEPTWELE